MYSLVMFILVMMFAGLSLGQRPQVDPGVVLTIQESCAGYPDGTVCTKRCVDISCDPKMARCYKVVKFIIKLKLLNETITGQM